ncbi:MAG: hypothetical protein CM1200mP30_03870 [Pseudomonadota bacterium]|nr:MAG: hypothetical protein CM1200mP30_03870 [Pseudomonadota bacterium]
MRLMQICLLFGDWKKGLNEGCEKKISMRRKIIRQEAPFISAVIMG